MFDDVSIFNIKSLGIGDTEPVFLIYLVWVIGITCSIAHL